MTPERYQQVNRLLDEVLELSPEERAAYLSAACDGDEALRREVESLLQSHDQAHSFIETLVAAEAGGLFGKLKGGEMIGRTLSHYQLRSLLGAGGMGEVYRATDPRLGRDVAVKILPAHLSLDDEARRRFQREAKVVAALSHPNICAIYDYGIEQDVTFMVMELLEGETLRANLSRSVLPWHEATEIGTAVANGLAAAHVKGIIHRDLKPENIFLTTDEQVKILDFGIAHINRIVSPEAETGLPTTTQTTKPGTVIGTVGYMSPEQVRGEKVEAPSDIFSLGCVLYEMVSGRRPFARNNSMETLAATLTEDPPILADTVKGIPRQVEQVIRHCLEKQPAGRYQSARDLSADLHALDRGTAVKTAPAARLKQRHTIIGLGAAVVVSLLAIALIFYLTVGPEQAIDSIAVLPLVNTGGDAETEYLSDEITESLINSLSQLQQLRVMASSTVINYKGKTIEPRQIGRELNVRAVLTWRMSQHGGELIIWTTLVNVADGAQLWGYRYSKKTADIFALQEEIAARIPEKLHLTLTGEEQRQLVKRYKSTESPEALQLYATGRHFSNKRTMDGFKEGIKFLNKAIDEDPTYALAHAGLAACYEDASGFYFPPSEAMPKAQEAVTKALKFDPELPEAHTALGYYKAQYERDWVGAENAYQRALELNHGYAPAYQYYAVLLMQLERKDEAIAKMTRALELTPLSSWVSTNLAWLHHLARRDDEAITQLKRIIDIDENFAVAHWTLGLAYEQKKKFDEAIKEFNLARGLDPENPFPLGMLGHIYGSLKKRGEAQLPLNVLKERESQGILDPFHIAIIYVGLGEKDQALAWLEKAVEWRSEEVLLLKVEPRYDSLRSDPRFANLLRQINLAP